MTATTSTAKPVNVSQLCYEMGSVALRAVGPDADGVTAIEADVDQAVLDDAVETHVADPAFVPPSVAAARSAEQTEQANEATLEDRAIAALNTNAAFLSKTSPTNVEVVEHVRLLTRECSALIRLVLRRFDTAN